MKKKNHRILLIFLVVISSLLLLGIQNRYVNNANADSTQEGIWEENVEPEVLAELAAAYRTDFRVRFLARPDLSAAEGMEWLSRGWFVYRSLINTAERSQEDAIAYLKERGIGFQSSFSGNELYVWGGDIESLRTLAAMENVSRIYVLQSYTIADSPLIGLQSDSLGNPLQLVASSFFYTVENKGRSVPGALSWAVTDVKADQFWNTFNLQGEGILVANIDTGVQWDHPALINAYKCQDNPGDPACWFDPENDCGGLPCDTNGHGTATMGPMVGDNEQSLPYQVGVAPGAQWIACKGCDGASCPDFVLSACADWIVAPDGDPSNRPHLVSNSWQSFQGCDNWFTPYVDAWRAAGIAPTFSPGGSGPGCGTLRSPGDYMTVFSSTAHDDNRTVGSFAGRGPSCFGTAAKPDISAPGINLCLPAPTDDWSCYNGTSFSNAYGAGSLALLMSCAPGLQWNVDSLFEALEGTADIPPSGSCGAPPDGDGNFTYGHGYINLLAAGQAFCENQSMGFIQGYVYDRNSNLPLAGASILAEKWGNGWQAITNTYPSGYYSMTLQTGTYSVSVDLLHYSPIMTDSIMITAEQTVNLDFYLLPQGRLYGYVSNHEDGSPIAATIQADSVLTETNPLNGFYEMHLNEGNHQVLVAADGYISQSTSISLTAGIDLQLDFQLVPISYPITPTASFLSNSPIMIGETAIFTNTSDPGNPPEPIYLWAFGDSYTSTLENPNHIYIDSGFYTVTLEVCNQAGCDDELKSFEVLDRPLADISVEKIDLIDPVTSGDTLYYQITAVNYGPNDAINVLFTDTPAYEFTLITSSYGCSVEDENVSCSYPELVSGNEIVIILGFAFTAGEGALMNYVQVTSDTQDLNLLDNDDIEYTIIYPSQAYKIHIPLIFK